VVVVVEITACKSIYFKTRIVMVDV
jgi:hypothetical protein